MNNGQNIVYLGTERLFRTPGDSITTSLENLTELQRAYCCIKSKELDAGFRLQQGYRADGFSNLYLFNPPVVTRTETHSYFACSFFGILEQAEGGRGVDYETIDRTTNVSQYQSDTTLLRYTQPVERYFYTIPQDAPDRSQSRSFVLPATVPVTRITTGTIQQIPGTQFFWEYYDLERVNYGRFDMCRESWRLSSKLNT